VWPQVDGDDDDDDDDDDDGGDDADADDCNEEEEDDDGGGDDHHLTYPASLEPHAGGLDVTSQPRVYHDDDDDDDDVNDVPLMITPISPHVPCVP
jgi:hypothetical protein